MKRLLSISVLLQTFTMLIMSVLLAVLAIYAMQATQSERQARRVPVIVDLSTDLFSSIQNVRLERAMVDQSLRMPESIDSATRKEIAAQRIRFATALDVTSEENCWNRRRGNRSPDHGDPQGSRTHMPGCSDGLTRACFFPETKDQWV